MRIRKALVRHEISPRIHGFPRILKGGKCKNNALKQLFLIPEIPKVPTVGAPLPHLPPARSIRSLAKLSSSFFKYFLSHPCLVLGLSVFDNYDTAGIAIANPDC